MKAFLLLLITLPTLSLAQQATPVHSVTVNYQPLTHQVEVNGRLANKSQQRMAFKIAGPVAQVFVDEGQQVKPGQLLASLDKAEINAQVTQAKALYANNQRNLVRMQQLFKKKLVSDDALQNAETQLQVAAANQQIALFNLKHADIHAKQAGTVLRRLIEPNELVAPNQTAFLLSNRSQGWILRGMLTDKDIVTLRPGNEAEIRFDAYPNQRFTGQVSEVAAAADTTSGLFEIEIQLSPTPLPLHSGFVAHAKITNQQNQHVALLPLSAMVSANAQQAEVFVLDAQHQVHKRQITWLTIVNGQLAVSSGLQQGEQVISKGAAYLRDGQQVALQATKATNTQTQ